MSRIKEPCYFTDFDEHEWTGAKVEDFKQPWLSDWKAYDALFEARPGATVRVDGSTDYLWNEPAAQRISDFAQDHRVKVVAILRDPVERAISQHQHLLRDGFTTESLQDALEAEEERRAQHMHPLFYHVARSRYSAAVHRYRERFGEDFLILDYHEFKTNPNVVLERLGRFVGFEPASEAPVGQVNAGMVYRNQLLRRFMRSPYTLQLGRKLVPQKYRASIRSKVRSWTTTRYRPTPDEVADLRARLAGEIALCEADPLIPTSRWRLAKAGTAGLPDRWA